MSKQWEDTSDLLTVHRDVKVALCYDFKRRPVNPIDFDGLIQFDTLPWATLDECRAARNDFDRWKNSAHAVLKTWDDWIAFEAWRPTRRRKSYAVRTPFENAVVTAWARYPNRTTRSFGNRSPSAATSGASMPAGTISKIVTNPAARVPPRSKA